ncbi:MAG: phosphonopyruvate decarboxylase [Bacteroidales bacterium]|nr:phosphonopyruvate decarboxylase [Bacteroidales bacterium]
MLRPSFFIDQLSAHGVDFFTGVPDSLLKSVCAYIADHLDPEHNIIAANEGGAVALAAGYHLATGKVGCVYMQNSGEGNAVNPLTSLTDKEVYHIPVLLLIGWRGRPGVHDEPQHVKQGKITTGLLNVLGINYEVLSKEEEVAQRQIDKAMTNIYDTGEAFALVVEKDTFESYTLQNIIRDEFEMSREEAIQMVAASLPNDAAVVSTTGMISRELFEYRTAMGQAHERDFLTVGSMGHASMIALGIALQHPERKVYCFDGDGASIMHMGNMAIVGSKHPKNYVHVVFNNGAHDSVGGQPTVGHQIDLVSIAKALRYDEVCSVRTKAQLAQVLDPAKEGLRLIEVMVRKGNRKDLGRPTSTPIQNKEMLMRFLDNRQ